MSVANLRPDMDHWQDRVDLAAAFRRTARPDLHEAVANHFSPVMSDDGARFLMNPNQVHYSRNRASELLLPDAGDPDTLNRPGAPDPTARGPHGSLHRRCAIHVHSVFATVLASPADSSLPPIDQNTATFYDRYVIDDESGGLAFEAEGERCARLLRDPKKKTLIMGNHGVMVTGDTVADTFNRLFCFERAAQTYIRVLQTGRPLRVTPDAIAEKTAAELDAYPGQAERHLAELKAILDSEGSDYAT
jgi:ribulose-5-phosphate 4-epimerase/fuculose-1-phosphate aldolase